MILHNPPLSASVIDGTRALPIMRSCPPQSRHCPEPWTQSQSRKFAKHGCHTMYPISAWSQIGCRVRVQGTNSHLCTRISDAHPIIAPTPQTPHGQVQRAGPIELRDFTSAIDEPGSLARIQLHARNARNLKSGLWNHVATLCAIRPSGVAKFDQRLSDMDNQCQDA